LSDFRKSSLFIIILAAAIILAAVILSGCISEREESAGFTAGESLKGTGDEGKNESDIISAATTIAPLAGLISAVGKDRVRVAVIVPPGAEPHAYEPSPSQMKEIADADIYIMNGAGLEFWMEKALLVNEDMLVVDSSRGVELLNEDGKHTDPHIWMSLENAAIQVENICNALIQFDRKNAEYYRQNKDNFLEDMRALDRELKQTFAAKKNRTFIVYHPAWSYFARDYGLVQVPIMEEEKEPGPKYLAGLIDMARENNISVIFVDPQFNPKSAEVIAREMNARIVVLDPLAEDYLQNMRHTGEEISKSLK